MDSVKKRVTIINEGTIIEGKLICEDLSLSGLLVGDAIVHGRADVLEKSEIRGTLNASAIKFGPGAKIEKFNLINK